MDGAIVADYITAGVLNGNVLRVGVIRDYNSNVILDLDKGALTMKKGSINIGNGNFTVDEQGNLYARRGTFAGTLAGAKGTFGGTVQAEDFLDKYGNSMMDLAKEKFTAGYLDLYADRHQQEHWGGHLRRGADGPYHHQRPGDHGGREHHQLGPGEQPEPPLQPGVQPGEQRL